MGVQGVIPPAKFFLKLQYASFLLPLHADNTEQESLNRFLRGHRVVQTRKELVSTEGMSSWAILILVFNILTLSETI